MRTRPLSITIVGWLFVVTGCVGLVFRTWVLLAPSSPAETAGPRLQHFVPAALSSLLAAAGGAFALRARPWSRWALAVWMGFHVGLSFRHSTEQLAAHVAIFAPLFYLLFRPAASQFFRGA